MLILTRAIDQKIIIGDNIEITVLDIQGDKVSLGITAPREVTIHRQEVYVAIQEENRQAAQSVAVDLGKISRLLKKGQAGEQNGEEGGLTAHKCC